MNFAVYMAFSFTTFFRNVLVPFFSFYIYICLYVLYASVYCCKLCIFIVRFTYFYCYVRSVYSVPLCCSVYCLWVNVHCTTATRCHPIAANKIYIKQMTVMCLNLFNMYHIIFVKWKT